LNIVRGLVTTDFVNRRLFVPHCKLGSASIRELTMVRGNSLFRSEAPGSVGHSAANHPCRPLSMDWRRQSL